jgi:hypothetical protein
VTVKIAAASETSPAAIFVLELGLTLFGRCIFAAGIDQRALAILHLIRMEIGQERLDARFAGVVSAGLAIHSTGSAALTSR